MIKKISLMTVTLSVCCTAFAAQQLTVSNQSDQFSTAIVNGQCISGLQVFTPPGKTDKLPWTTIQLICGSTTGTCHADVYITDANNCANFQHSSHNIKVTTASMNLASGDITPPSATMSGYTMIATPYSILFTGKANAR